VSIASGRHVVGQLDVSQSISVTQICVAHPTEHERRC